MLKEKSQNLNFDKNLLAICAASTAANGTDELLPECHRPHSSAQLGKFMLHGLSSFR
jgi:hypothetical protein